MSGTVFEGSGGGAWVMGNETFDHSRASMDRVMGDRLAGRPLGDAEQIGANEKAAIKTSSTGLKTFTGMAQTPYLNTIRCRARGGVMKKILSTLREEFQIYASVNASILAIGRYRK